MRVHQLGHGLIPGDAISHHTLEIDRRLRAWGLESRIFAGHVSPEYQDLAQTEDYFQPFLDTPDDLLIYHYSIYDPNYRLFKAARPKQPAVNETTAREQAAARGTARAVPPGTSSPPTRYRR